MRAVIMAIGSELLQGFLTDTNSTFLAQELSALGVEVTGIIELGDDLNAIVRGMAHALESAEILVCTGGIGPTSDDLTREAVAAFCSETPEVDPQTLETVRSFFTKRGVEMPARNVKQAWKIPSAEILHNPMGTAPGWFVRYHGAHIVIMPGVPREMMPMWRDEAVPRLLPALGGDSIVSTTLKTIGIGESAVEDLLRTVIDRDYPTVSTYAKNDGVHVRILAISQNGTDAELAVKSTESEIRGILGSSVYGYLNTSLPAAVLGPLRDAGSSLAIWEHGTGGQVTALFLSDPGFEELVVESRVVAKLPFHDDAARDDLASHIASGFQASTGASYAIAVLTAFEEADGMGRFDAQVDIAIAGGSQTSRSTHRLTGRKAEVGRRASLLAAEVFRMALPGSTTRLPE